MSSMPIPLLIHAGHGHIILIGEELEFQVFIFCMNTLVEEKSRMSISSDE